MLVLASKLAGFVRAVLASRFGCLLAAPPWEMRHCSGSWFDSIWFACCTQICCYLFGGAVTEVFGSAGGCCLLRVLCVQCARCIGLVLWGSGWQGAGMLCCPFVAHLQQVQAASTRHTAAVFAGDPAAAQRVYAVCPVVVCLPARWRF